MSNDYQDRLMDDGAVIESALPMDDKPAENTRYRDLRVYKAQVEEVIFVDDQRNKTGKVEYDLIIISGNSNEGYRKVRNAVSLNSLGGVNDYEETIYKPKTKEFSRGTELGKPHPANTNGDIVALVFLEGNEEFPVILGPWSHKRNSKAAITTDGHRMKGEYNGVQWEINKDGELIITMLGGPRDDDGNLTNESNGNLLIKLGKDGKITIDSGSQPIITIDKNGNSITCNAKTITLDSGNQPITTIDGDGNETTVESATVKIGSGAIEPIVLGDQWVIFENTQVIPKINALIAAVGTLIGEFNAHTHPYTWTDGPGSGSTGTADQGSSGASPPATSTSAGAPQLATKGKVE